MRGYELTERGKLLISFILIAFLLIILALTLIAWSLSRNTTTNDLFNNPGTSKQDEIEDLTPEQVTDVTTSDEDNSLQGDIIIEPAFFDADTGILTLQFIPATQISLDDSALSLLSELVSSPQYTDDSVFTVEIPHLPDEDEAVTLTTAIVGAFTSLDVPLKDIVFFVYQAESNNGKFDVRISLS